MIQHINEKLLLFPLVLLTAVTSIGINQVKAWDGPWGGGSCDNGPDGQFGGPPLSGGECGAYCAGEQDAEYDHINNLQYQPYGSCLPCHSEDYWNNFHEGYDRKWNSYQSQDSSQGSFINIYGNNNYVETNQYSGQQQNPLQQLAHLACGWVNCNQPSQGGP